MIHRHGIFFTVKGLFSTISAGDDIFPMLQEEIEKNSAFLGITFLDLGRNLETLTDWSHWQLTADLLQRVYILGQQNLSQMLNVISINKNAKKTSHGVEITFKRNSNSWGLADGEKGGHIYTHTHIRLFYANLKFYNSIINPCF